MEKGMSAIHPPHCFGYEILGTIGNVLQAFHHKVVVDYASKGKLWLPKGGDARSRGQFTTSVQKRLERRQQLEIL
jgi:hypothetical protein